MNAGTLAAYALAADDRATEVGRSSTDHGPRHWRDVARIGLTLADLKVDGRVLYLFAALHDSQRMNEWSDPDHGERAARVAEELLEGEQETFPLITLCDALLNHDRGETASDKTIATCWDADRLTLSRVGIIPDRRFMSLSTTRTELSARIAHAERVMQGDDQTWKEIADAYADFFGWPDA